MKAPDPKYFGVCVWGGIGKKAEVQKPNRVQGAAKRKNGNPRGGWVGQRPKKDQGPIYFFDIFLSCFWSPLTEKRPKNVIKQIEEKSVLDF
jgi:hypothetical protein